MTRKTPTGMGPATATATRDANDPSHGVSRRMYAASRPVATSRARRARARPRATAGGGRVAARRMGDGRSSSAAVELLERLEKLYVAGDRDAFAAAVRTEREHLTISFYDAAEDAIEERARGGDVDGARALDEAVAATAALGDYSLDEIVSSAELALPGGTKDVLTGEGSSETGLTAAQDEEVRLRWRAMTGSLATTGEENATKQLALNVEARRNAIMEIAGRVSIGSMEFEALKSVAPEQRIAEVLLTFPPGANREAAVEDAITPPADGEAVEGDEENEIVFTTAPRLLNTLEGMARQRRRALEDCTDLDELIAIVERKCDFLSSD